MPRDAAPRRGDARRPALPLAAPARPGRARRDPRGSPALQRATRPRAFLQQRSASSSRPTRGGTPAPDRGLGGGAAARGAVAARASGGRGAAGVDGDDRHVVDYLARGARRASPRGPRAFLVRTSILERMSGSSVRRGDRRRDVRPIRLAELERRNLFTVALDPQRRWYRTHPLFAEVLRARLEVDEPGTACRAAPARGDVVAGGRRRGPRPSPTPSPPATSELDAELVATTGVRLQPRAG